MGENSKIEWCHLQHLTARQITTTMTAIAYCLHVKPVRAFINLIMVVFLRGIATIETRQKRNSRQSALSYCIVHGIPSLAFSVGQFVLGLSGLSTTTQAFCGNSITTRSVDAEGGYHLPSATPPAELLPRFDTLNIVFDRRPCASSRHFHYPNFAAHIPPILNGNNYTFNPIGGQG